MFISFTSLIFRACCPNLLRHSTGGYVSVRGVYSGGARTYHAHGRGPRRKGCVPTAGRCRTQDVRGHHLTNELARGVGGGLTLKSNADRRLRLHPPSLACAILSAAAPVNRTE